MPMPSDARKWFGVPGRIALLLGIGALSAGSGQANAKAIDQGRQPAPAPQAGADDGIGLRVWSEDGRIYLVENGGTRELRLGDTAEARRLRELLLQHGATEPAAAVGLHRMILAGDGGAGLHWTPPGRKPGTAAATIKPSTSDAQPDGSMKPVRPAASAPPTGNTAAGGASKN